MTNYNSAQQRRKAQMTDTNTLAPTDAEILALLPTVKLKDEDPKRMVWLTRKDALTFVRAVLAKFGTPAPASQPVAATAGMGPVASKSHGAWDGIEDVLAMPDGTDIYTAAQVQAMLAAAPSGSAREPLDRDDIKSHAREAFDDPAEELGFYEGVRWAEKQHGITAAPKGEG